MSAKSNGKDEELLMSFQFATQAEKVIKGILSRRAMLSNINSIRKTRGLDSMVFVSMENVFDDASTIKMKIVKKRDVKSVFLDKAVSQELIFRIEKADKSNHLVFLVLSSSTGESYYVTFDVNTKEPVLGVIGENKCKNAHCVRLGIMECERCHLQNHKYCTVECRNEDWERHRVDCV